MAKDLSPLFKGFSKLSREERFERLMKMGALSAEEAQYLRKGGLQDITLGEKFIENVVGYFQLPLGVATNFRIDGNDFVIPLAVEETSIVAAASKTARWVREAGRIETKSIGRDIIGQIQIAKVRDFSQLHKIIEQNREYFIRMANEDVAHGLVKRGGGVTNIKLRQVDRGDGSLMAVIHVYADPCEAMGANIMNQVCEYLKGPIQDLSGEVVTMCILSNLVDSKLTE
ncbi:MAG: hypothetical protein KAG66_13065, partial [Methylococcales bacterium]|nr:hypothetical protein [Methylococcales bacterium]